MMKKISLYFLILSSKAFAASFDPYTSYRFLVGNEKVSEFDADKKRWETDASFSCRRPATHFILSELFGPSPLDPDCHLFAQMPLTRYTDIVDNGTSFYELNPEHLIDVDYVFVKGGKRINQRFGHSLLRLTFCSPDEDVDDCRDELDHQYVISYRGVDSLVKDKNTRPSLGALLMPFTDILLEYSSKDKRQLKIYPLKLTQNQKTLLVLGFLEKSALDRRNYHLVTENCATALADLINMISPPKQQIHLKIATPRGLARALRDKKWIRTDQIEKMMPVLQEISETAKTLHVNGIEKTEEQTFSERSSMWFTFPEDEPHLQLISTIENHQHRMQEVRMARYLKRIVHSYQTKKHSLSAEEISFAEAFMIYTTTASEKIQSFMLKHPDGIPTQEDFIDFSKTLSPDLPEQKRMLHQLKEHLLSGMKKESLKIEEFLVEINNKILTF